MCIVRFIAQPVERRQRQLIDVVDSILVAGGPRETELGAQVEEDVGRLAQEEVAVPQRWGGERGWVRGVAGVGGGYEGSEGGGAGLGVGVAGVEVGGLGLFEAEADVFAAAREGGPVEEFVGWGGGGCGRGGFLAFGGR